MNWSPPRLIGTPPFRALTSGFAPAAGAAGFRPVVAGQYLRETSDVNALELVFLEPAAPTRAAAHWSITISPQWIWQHLSGTAAGRAKSSATTNSTESTRHTNTGQSDPPGQSDRLSFLRELASWVSSQREMNERHDGPRTHLATTTNTQSRQDFATRTERNFRSDDSPIPLTFRQSADALPVASSSVDTRERSAFHEREIIVRPMYGEQTAGVPQSGWHTRFVNHTGGDHHSTTTQGHPLATRSSPPLVLTQQSRSVLARFVADESERSAPATRTGAAEARHTAVPPIGFGTVATLAIRRPANLVPAVFQVVNRDARDASETSATTVVIHGAGSAEAFADALTRRLGRSVQTASDAGAPSPVSTVVRMTPRPAMPTPTTAPATTVVQNVSQAAPAPPGNLTPSLMQQLTEQVVRALDARAVAERERMGGF